MAQLVARESHSRFSRRKASEVVPADMRACATTMAEWMSELRWSTDCGRTVVGVRLERDGRNQQRGGGDAR